MDAADSEDGELKEEMEKMHGMVAERSQVGRMARGCTASAGLLWAVIAFGGGGGKWRDRVQACMAFLPARCFSPHVVMSLVGLILYYFI